MSGYILLSHPMPQELHWDQGKPLKGYPHTRVFSLPDKTKYYTKIAGKNGFTYVISPEHPSDMIRFLRPVFGGEAVQVSQQLRRAVRAERGHQSATGRGHQEFLERLAALEPLSAGAHEPVSAAAPEPEPAPAPEPEPAPAPAPEPEPEDEPEPEPSSSRLQAQPRPRAFSLLCAGCKQSKAKTEFEPDQRSKGLGVARCAECVNTLVPPGYFGSRLPSRVLRGGAGGLLARRDALAVMLHSDFYRVNAQALPRAIVLAFFDAQERHAEACVSASVLAFSWAAVQTALACGIGGPSISPLSKQPVRKKSQATFTRISRLLAAKPPKFCTCPRALPNKHRYSEMQNYKILPARVTGLRNILIHTQYMEVQ